MNQTPQDSTRDEHAAVVSAICKANQERFTVLSNLEKEIHHIAGFFPDIILQDKKSGDPIFIMEVRKNGDIAKCLQQWKTLPKAPAFLYVVVPKTDLGNAKAMAQVIGLQVKFGFYEIAASGSAIVKYE